MFKIISEPVGLVLLADFLFIERLKNCFRFSFKKEKGGKKKGKKKEKKIIKELLEPRQSLG